MIPELLQLGPVHLHSYGVMMAIAFLVGTWLGLLEARRLSLDEDKLLNVIIITLVASVLGARALYVIEHLAEFRREWGSILALWQGGLTLYGGVIAGTFAGLTSAKRMGMPRWVVADALTPSLALGTMFGRIGCFLNGCCYGRPTHLPWGVTFPPGSFAALEFGNTPVHPSQLYNAAAGLAIFVALWALRRRLRTPGVLFWSFIVVFALVRIPIDLTRTYEADAVIVRGAIELTESQATSIVMALFGVLMILRLRREAAPALGMNAPVRLAVLGDPLAYTLSPVLHRAGCEALGLACEAHALRTPPGELGERLRDLAARGFLGCNLTHPLKEHALDHVARASVAAERSRSINTIAFQPEGWWGETTDGPGFVDLLRALGRDPALQRAVLLGAGGAARSLALALHWAGCRDVRVSARRGRDTQYAWGEGLDERFLGWRSSEEEDALRTATIVVNCTPLSGDEPPAPLASIGRGALTIDLTYGAEPTRWVRDARVAGLEAVDGLGLLVHQARRSLSLWLGREVPLEPLALAVGWPR